MATKGSYKNEEERDKWMSVMKIEAMSSDESGIDDDEDVIVVHPLPWISSEVDSFKNKLDQAILNEKSSQARRQTKRRLLGSPSTRQMPKTHTLPSWALTK